MIREALRDGPVSVGVCGTDLPFLFYSSGIFDFPDCCDLQNHALLIVGYGRDPELQLDYWIAQNSWGRQWGENGFMRLLRSIALLILSRLTNNLYDFNRREEVFGDGVCGLTLNPSQAIGGYFINRDGSVIVGNGVSFYFLPLYRFLQYLQSNWKVNTVLPL